MSTVIAFQSRPELSAQENIRNFIEACRSELTVFGRDLPFESDSWDVTDSVRLKSQGAARHRLIFTTLASTGTATPEMFQEPFKSFSKALIRYMFGLRPSKTVGRRLAVMRLLDAAITARLGISDPVKLASDDFNRAAQMAKDRYCSAYAVHAGQHLEVIAKFMTEQRLCAVPIHWRSFLKHTETAQRIGKKFDELRKAKLPSAAALDALPRIFRSAIEPKDVFVTSVTAILSAAPDRISEVLHLPANCEHEEFNEDGTTRAYGLRWWPSKGADPMIKWLIPSMWSVVKAAVEKIRQISEPARRIAKWYEENPNSIYLPDELSHLRTQEWLTIKDLGMLFGMDHKTSPHYWCDNAGIEVIKEQNRRRVRFRDVERIVVGMVPKWFPYLNPDLELKYQDALCIVRRHELGLAHGTYQCAIEPVTTNQINIPLGSCIGNRFRSIFERHGFTEPDGSPIRISTHQFRHYLNTLAQAGGLSDVDIAKWSGRKDIRQNEVYDHLTADQMLVKVQQAIGDASKMFGPLAELPANLPVSRSEFGILRAPTAHTTDFGFCIHDYTMSPCQLHRDCLHCRDHVCVKGDPVKLKRLQDRLDEARSLMEKAEQASSEGYAGSNRWLEHHKSTVERLTQILQIMNDPMVPFGAIVQLAPPPQAVGGHSRASALVAKPSSDFLGK